ncbi:Uncharacterized protein TCM_013083 [Theobroma cacao]|uniref:Uncharacterized protein n=1 Tax=Theobroma cacao TaxID=3641 RepID=A0A061FW55_THECC|nr:Uncharacterized protein TCM_013083 [Theobroma cacao]
MIKRQNIFTKLGHNRRPTGQHHKSIQSAALPINFKPFEGKLPGLNNSLILSTPTPSIKHCNLFFYLQLKPLATHQLTGNSIFNAINKFQSLFFLRYHKDG